MKTLFFVLASFLSAQSAFRYDPTPVYTTPGNTPPGASAPMFAVPGSTIALCSNSSCTATATSYTNGAGNVACPVNAPVVLANGATCQTVTGSLGQFGFWLLPGSYWYMFTTPNGFIGGPFAFTVGGGGSGGSSAFSSITSGTNNVATMNVGAGASIQPVSSGIVNANLLNGVTLATLSTGLLKITNGSGAPSNASAADVVNLFIGCSGSQYLGADGNCHSAIGSGTVTSIALAAPGWLSIAGSPITTSGTITIGAQTGQTSHQVIGTCGGATSFGPCALVAADIPTLNQNTTGNAATATALQATPTQCTGGQFATGVQSSGNANCATVTTSFIPQQWDLTKTGSAQWTLGTLCTSSTPCIIRAGSKAVQITAPVACSLSGSTDTSTIFFYIDNAQNLSCGSNTTATVTPSSGILAPTSVTAFPFGAEPLWQATFTANVVDTITPAMDRRSPYGHDPVTAGFGITMTQNSAGLTSVAVDTSVVSSSHVTSGAYPAPGTCVHSSSASDLYLLTSGVLDKAICTATNTWTYLYDGLAITPAALLTGYAATNNGAAESHANGYATLTALTGSGTTMSWIEWTAASAPYTATVFARNPFWTLDAAMANGATGVGFMDGTGKQIYLLCGQANGTFSGVVTCFIRHGTNGGFTANDLAGVQSTYFGSWGVVLKDDNTNLHWGITTNGTDYTEIFSQSRTAWLASGPTKLFFGFYSNGAATSTATLVGVK